MLHEPTPTTPALAPPAGAPADNAVPDVVPAPRATPEAEGPQDARSRFPVLADLPSDLRPLGRRARRDTAAARELVSVLLGRHWDHDLVAVASGLAAATVTSLAGVHRPGTAAGFVADGLVARARARAEPTPRVS